MRHEASCELGLCWSAGACAEGTGPSAWLSLLHGGDVRGILEDTVNGYEAGILAHEDLGRAILRIALFAGVGDL